jgi:glycopeptide antibiotics resistance protein
VLVYFGARHLLVGICLLSILLLVLWRKKHSLSYLLFFTAFWMYLLAVVQAVIFPIAIGTSHGGKIYLPNLNLIPFYFGDCFMINLCVRSIIENIVLTIPFGFGINFLVRLKPRNIFWLSLAVGFVFELSQLFISLALKSGFRSVDINDVIFNSMGVLIGYALFRLFAWVYLKIIDQFPFKNKGLFRELYDVAFQAQSAGRR